MKRGKRASPGRSVAGPGDHAKDALRIFEKHVGNASLSLGEEKDFSVVDARRAVEAMKGAEAPGNRVAGEGDFLERTRIHGHKDSVAAVVCAGLVKSPESEGRSIEAYLRAV